MKNSIVSYIFKNGGSIYDARPLVIIIFRTKVIRPSFIEKARVLYWGYQFYKHAQEGGQDSNKDNISKRKPRLATSTPSKPLYFYGSVITKRRKSTSFN
jgi:hypothetical protein